MMYPIPNDQVFIVLLTHHFSKKFERLFSTIFVCLFFAIEKKKQEKEIDDEQMQANSNFSSLSLSLLLLILWKTRG